MRLKGRKTSSRRRFVRLLGTGSAIGIAGCIGDTPDNTGENGGDDTEPEFHDHPGNEPREVSSWFCDGICAMDVSEYPEWDAQLAHDDGTGAFFCTTGCLMGYYVFPDHHDAPSSITNVWVTGYETKELVDGREAYYVLVRDSDLVSDPMGINPRPFADESDALAYLDDHEDDEITEDDVIRLSEADSETAAIYRGNRLPV